MNKITFFKEGLKNLKTVGTVTRSSAHVCRNMVKHIDFENARVIVELGAGDGVITKHILKRMNSDAILLSFEINKKFAAVIESKFKDPRLKVINDSAESLDEYLSEFNFDHIDYIVSAIPFVALPDKLSRSIISNCRDNLRYDGKFIQIHYSLLTKKLYENIFGNVRVFWTPINIPPAFILVSSKNGHVVE